MADMAHCIQLIFGEFEFCSPYDIFAAWTNTVLIGIIYTHQEIAQQFITALIRHRDFVRLKFKIVILWIAIVVIRTVRSGVIYVIVLRIIVRFLINCSEDTLLLNLCWSF